MTAPTLERFRPGFDAWREATLSPMKFATFRTLWFASVTANLGSVVQAVGAAWMMSEIAGSPDMVALVQTAATAPMVVLSLVGGALADISDRRALMVWAQVLGLVTAGALATLGFLGLITPSILLGMTLLIGCSAALHQPAWQAAVGDLVTRATLPAAIALNALAFNLARSLGPALGGVVVAAAGAPFAFAINAVSYVGLIAALIVWKRPASTPALPPEPIVTAMIAGLRYVSLSPAITGVLARGAAFGFSAGAVYALLPVIARDKLGGGALSYGLLLCGFGVGSMIAALLTARLRAQIGAERLVRFGVVTFALATAITGLSTSAPFTVLALIAAGAAWILVLATFATGLQMSCPRWVVGRAVAIGQACNLGGLATGSAVWGALAKEGDLAWVFGAAALAALASALLERVFPLPEFDGFDLRPGSRMPMAAPAAAVDPRTGPIVVEVEYDVHPEAAADFLTAMHEVGRIRRRDGARRWSIQQDLDAPARWVERFHSPTWMEHLRRQSRVTMSDQAARDRALSFHNGAPPVIRRMAERPPGSEPLE